MGRFRVLAAVTVATTAVALLAGCVQGPAKSAPTHKATTKPSASASAPAPAVLVPGGSAKANKPFFDQVNSALIASNGSVDGRTIIDNLVKSGFDKAAMQLTPDKTSIGIAADSVLFSVRIDKSCLMGQRSAAGYSSSINDALAGGSCIVGKTRAINW
jgi:hypothetical protein